MHSKMKDGKKMPTERNAKGGKETPAIYWTQLYVFQGLGTKLTNISDIFIFKYDIKN